MLRLFGCCLQEFPLLIVVEYADFGDLNTFLVENHAGKFKRGEQGPVQLNLRRLCGFAADIANGMAFLSKKKWVHRGRVCIMTERFNLIPFQTWLHATAS